MPYIPGKRLYHADDIGSWTEDDWARNEADKAADYVDQHLKERVFHEWKERRHYQRFKKQFLESLINRYGYKCACCGTTETLQVDHKTPVSKGGVTCGDNLQFLCVKCNGLKGDKLYYVWLREIRAAKS
jgi:5-methylcytosine-specific restriction endonuclease McrA